jgi:IclR family acetate operon transcriptional repressor
MRSETSTDGDRRYRIQSVERALTALEAIASAGAKGLALSDLARGLGTSKSTALSLLRTLAERDFVVQVEDRRYRLGLALARLGDQAVSQLTLYDVAMPVLRRLTVETGRTARVGVLDDGFAVVIGRVDGPGSIRIDSHLGRRELPHCSALGKAILAQLAEDDARAVAHRIGLPARTPNTITDVDALVRELARVRERGFALDDEEDSVGVFCVGAPVRNHRAECVGAISVSGVKVTLGGGFGRLPQVVVEHAREISTRLGAKPA